jgi:hypothetical protein
VLAEGREVHEPGRSRLRRRRWGRSRRIASGRRRSRRRRRRSGGRRSRRARASARRRARRTRNRPWDGPTAGGRSRPRTRTRLRRSSPRSASVRDGGRGVDRAVTARPPEHVSVPTSSETTSPAYVPMKRRRPPSASEPLMAPSRRAVQRVRPSRARSASAQLQRQRARRARDRSQRQTGAPWSGAVAARSGGVEAETQRARPPAQTEAGGRRQSVAAPAERGLH